ncbi:MAG: helix-turn-helix transcriptional regulator [Thiotrichaceae bacterium]|nr:helix-turn-helix transcriptional regulator [Thiotrichaceae bacterium]
MPSGNRLKDFRDFLGVSQQKLADNLGVSRGYLNDIERGRQEPSLNFAKKLLEVYNVNLNWFVDGIGEMMSTPDEKPTEEIDMKELEDTLELIQKQVGEALVWVKRVRRVR